MNVLRLTLRQLQIFVAVAASGSTTAGAGRVALSQSATSAAINELERLLSLDLFDRVGKRLQLNDNGRLLLPRALAMLDSAVGIEQMTRGANAQVRTVGIGASTTIGNYMLPALLHRIYASQPETTSAWQSRVRIGNTAQVCDLVAAFELDVGLIEGPSSRQELDVHPWLKDALVVVAAPAYAKRIGCKGLRAELATLRDAVWLIREPGSGTREETDRALLPRLHGYRRSIELGSSEAIKRAAAEGMGLACLSRCVVDELVGARRLAILQTPLPALFRQCYWVVHRDKRLNAATQRFAEFLENRGSGTDAASTRRPRRAG